MFQDGCIDYGEFVAMMRKGNVNMGIGRRTMRNALNVSIRDDRELAKWNLTLYRFLSKKLKPLRTFAGFHFFFASPSFQVMTHKLWRSTGASQVVEIYKKFEKKVVMQEAWI